jgi:hypothetical protein
MDELPRLPSLDELPTLAAARSDRGTNSLSYGLRLLGDGLSAGTIANARYKDASFVLTRVLEDAWRASVMSKFPLWGRNKAADEAHRFYPYSPSFLRMDKPRAEFAKMRDREKDPLTRSIHDAAVRFYDECIPLAKVILWAKAHAVKRAPPTAPPPEEALPQATREGRRIIRDALTTTLETVRADYRAQLLFRYIAIVEHLHAKRSEIDAKDAPNYGPQGLFFATFDALERDPVTRKASIRRRADWRRKTESFVDRSVQRTFDQFTQKNVEKLAAIIELKGNAVPQRQIIRATVKGSILETRMKFLFSDGSSFEVMNQIVEQHSPLGRSYVRFPTTFHEVHLADGSKLEQPSESTMKTVFVGLENESAEPTMPTP